MSLSLQNVTFLICLPAYSTPFRLAHLLRAESLLTHLGRAGAWEHAHCLLDACVSKSLNLPVALRGGEARSWFALGKAAKSSSVK